MVFYSLDSMIGDSVQAVHHILHLSHLNHLMAAATSYFFMYGYS